MNTAPRPVPLATLLRAARADLQRQAAPPWEPPLEAAAARVPVTAAPKTMRPRPGRRVLWPWWAAGAALACGLLLVTATRLMPLPGVDAAAGLSARSSTQAWRGDGFVPVVPVDRWAVAGAEPAWLVPAELPAERLAAMGLPYDPGHAADRVRAQLLVRASGELLAVRLDF